MTVNVFYIGMQARTISCNAPAADSVARHLQQRFKQDSLLQSCRPSSDTRLTELPEHRGSA
ncbi:hypothetical protein SAMN05216381_0215 [Pseudomonas seleniipraecipitans]|uniref:Uncharacterized protein n=1 Tax=Phytopseudomonas seleniipraecipitans TaxID=640205 RepID=A0A1G7GJ80_9GAMM|nr:hypothetical protein SAMN05216381_0215 [Pseudomonas seleniipraecipitans]